MGDYGELGAWGIVVGLRGYDAVAAAIVVKQQGIAGVEDELGEIIKIRFMRIRLP